MTRKRAKDLVELVRKGRPFDNEELFFILRSCEAAEKEAREKKMSYVAHLWGGRAAVVRNQIGAQNLGLIHSVAWKISAHNPTVDIDELVGVGQIAMTRAIHAFNVFRQPPVKFSTYAVWAIRREIYRVVNQPRTFGFDQRVHMKVSEPAYTPNTDEIMMVRNLLQENRAGLDEREMDVIRKWFFEDQKLHQIGSDFQVSRERIRQIRNKAVDKLRHLLDPEAETLELSA